MKAKILTLEEDKWSFSPINEFIGENESKIEYGIGLTPPDPDNDKISFVNIFPEFTIKNSNNNKDVFEATFKVLFSIDNDRERPIEQVIFECILTAYNHSLEIIKNKTLGTNLNSNFFQPPILKDMASVIQMSIDKVYKYPYK